MATTTIRVDETLKARIAAAAERAGKTAHAFILDAIAHMLEQDEIDAEFHRTADERWIRLLATKQTVPWDESKAWLHARLRGERRRRPSPRKLGD